MADENTGTATVAEKDRIPVLEKMVFATGDMGFNLIWMPMAIFANEYFTDICGIPVEWVTAMFFGIRFFDLFTDVGMGVICDRTTPKKFFGKFRFYMAWGALPLALASVAVFYSPDFDLAGRAIWLFLSYLALSLLYTVTNVPYSGQMKIMSRDYKERNLLSSYRMVGAQLGVLIITLGMKPLIDILGNVKALPENWKELPNAAELKAVFNAQTQDGYFYSMLIFGTIIALAVLGTALYAKDREKTEAVDWPTTKSNLLAMASCKPWWLILLAGSLTILAYTTRFGAIVYYIKYYFETNAINDWGGQGAVISLFFTSGTLCALAGSAAYGFIAKKFDKKNVFIILVAASGLVSIAFSVIPPDGVFMFVFIQIVFSFLMGPTGPIIFAMYTDVADHLKNHTGKDTEGLAMAVGSFANKFGWSVGPTLSLLVLSIVDYDPDAKTIDPDVISGLALMLGWVPAAACFLALIFVKMYPLNNVRMDQITKELIERENGKA